MPRSAATLRSTTASGSFLFSFLFVSLLGCPAPSADSAGGGERAAVVAALALPIADSVALRLAAEATALFDTSASVGSGPRSCDPAVPSQRSTRCELSLSVRADVAQFHPDAVPGRYAVLAAVRNTGDLPETRTSLAGGVTAYYLVEQGSNGRARAWYFSVDHGSGGPLVVIRESAYVACVHQHLGAKPLGAWRRCADAGAPTLGVAPEDPVLPLWIVCGVWCCVED